VKTNKGYFLFLDDVRNPSDATKFYSDMNDFYEGNEWVIARNYGEFCDIISERWEIYNESPIFISFDHDLGLEHTRYYFNNGGHANPPNPDNAVFIEKTGKDCANWLINFCEAKNMKFPDYIVHSRNPIGAQNIESVLDQYKKYIEDGKQVRSHD
jgi:hypothetical protein